MTQPWQLLKQIDVNSAKEDMRVGNTNGVGADWRVDRLQQAVHAAIAKRASECVVMHATAAIHSCGACR